MTAVEKLINIAKNELGYLEKSRQAYHKNPSVICSKTDGAGSDNITKYWADVMDSWQGEPWCAAFVTWCFNQAFGREKTAKMLKHYPYTYVPTIANLFTRYANPRIGDIVCFYRNGEFVHTGIVTSVQGDYFETVEGNTSGTNGIVANGGGVKTKGYYNSKMIGTKFVRPDYSLAETDKKLTSINDIVWELEHRGIITNKSLWLSKCALSGNAYWLAYKGANMTYNSPTLKKLETINDIVWELGHRGIMTDSGLWLDLLKKDNDLYWLANKICNMTENITKENL